MLVTRQKNFSTDSPPELRAKLTAEMNAKLDEIVGTQGTTRQHLAACMIDWLSRQDQLLIAAILGQADVNDEEMKSLVVKRLTTRSPQSESDDPLVKVGELPKRDAGSKEKSRSQKPA